MNLEDLKGHVDYYFKNLNNIDPKDVTVLITTHENSMGARASSEVKYVGMGFDWERGQLRIEPTKQLVAKGNSLTDVKSVECRQYDGRNYYFCPRCQSKISKNDCYCRECSQKLK